MITKFIEASNGFNWGKFLVGRFDPEEWQRPATMDGVGTLLARCGWADREERGHLLVLDLQTGEGAIFRIGGYAHADLEKHKVWVCPLFEPFLIWLYEQKVANILELPSQVTLDAPAAMGGRRRPGLDQQAITAIDSQEGGKDK